MSVSVRLLALITCVAAVLSGCAAPIVTVRVSAPAGAEVWAGETGGQGRTLQVWDYLVLKPGDTREAKVSLRGGRTLVGQLRVGAEAEGAYRVELTDAALRDVADGRLMGVGVFAGTTVGLSKDDPRAAGNCAVALFLAPAQTTPGAAMETARMVGEIARQLTSGSGCPKAGATLAILPPRGNLASGHWLAAQLLLELEHDGKISGNFALVERSRIGTVAGEFERQFNPLYDPATAVKVGKLVNAQYVLLPNYLLVGKELSLYARVVEVERGVVVAQARETGPAPVIEAGNPNEPPPEFWDRINRVIPDNRESEFSVSVWTRETEYHVGDTVQIRFEAGRDCHVYLIDAGTSGGLFLLYPNGYHADSAVTGGREYVVPASGDPYTIPVGGPKGWEGLKIVATLKPLDLGVKAGGAATQIDFDQRGAFARRLGEELRRLKREEWTVGTWAFRVK